MCFFFKQKTAYEMRISDWSSDVCSSDLTPLSPLYQPRRRLGRGGGDGEGAAGTERRHQGVARALVDEPAGRLQMPELRLSRRRLHQKAGILREWRQGARSEEHTSELQSLMRISYAVFCLKKKKHIKINIQENKHLNLELTQY